MIGWLNAALVAAAAAILALILLLIFKRFCKRKTQNDFIVSDDIERAQNLQNSIARLHQVSPHHSNHNNQEHHGYNPDNRDISKKTNNKNNNNYYNLLQRGTVSTPKKAPPFSWANHPSLVTDAVENGWSRFAFNTSVTSSPSLKSARSVLGVCTSNPPNQTSVEIDWEVCEGSADFVQKIRLNPNFKNNSNNIMSVIRTGLPLPGPNLGVNSSFPQEAYVEITICENDDDQLGVKGMKKVKSQGDKVKLIGEDFNAKNSPDSLSGRVTISGDSQRRTEMKFGRNEAVFVTVGLTGGGPLPLKIPGSYPGSIGFSSSGSVYLDGTKLISESKPNEWRRTNTVIGCGYNPSQKKVFFTVDSRLVHEIHCKSDEFSSPLYPTISTNMDATVLVNLGQSPFKYAQANMTRTPNPCFIGPLATSPALGYDSKELFSMGRIDSQWLQRGANRSANNTVNSINAMEIDQDESDGDLFEIVLDSRSTGRSPYAATPFHQEGKIGKFQGEF